ncbi:hypothetical protein [Frigidibacter sp. MR17.24]|uniref:hypothetical protein n=1 Tax=Frigidibacter sp. MR17.24 TaxID=3127345 RepID=UPI003012F90A
MKSALLPAALALTALAACNGPIGGVGQFGGAPAAPYGAAAPATAQPMFTPEPVVPQDSISTTSLG